MRKLLCFLMAAIIILFVAKGYAAAPNRELFGDFDGYVTLTSEKDITGVDRTLYKSEMSIYRSLAVGTFKLQPYYYFKGEHFDSPFADRKVVENIVGIDGVIQQSNLQKVSAGVGYKYKIKNTGAEDSLFITRIRLDF